MQPRHLFITLFVSLAGATAIILVYFFSFEEEIKEIQPYRNEVYTHLDKLCRDVNSLDKIQIAIYFLMQSWLKACDMSPNTVAFTPLKFMKKRIHDAVTKKIHEFNKTEERSVEDCIIEFYRTEIIPTKDDFHQMLFEFVLQGYVNTFGGDLDETGKFLKMETISCNNTESCQYSFQKPPLASEMFEKIMKKSTDEKEEVREKKCFQIFHYLYLWNEKIKKPESFDWAYYLLFKGLQKGLNTTEVDIKQHLKCYSEKMKEMEQALTSKVDEIEPFIILYLRERDVEIEILEDEVDYAPESDKDDLERRLNVQTLLAEIFLKTYIEVFDIKPNDDKITLTSASGQRMEVDIPPMEQFQYL